MADAALNASVNPPAGAELAIRRDGVFHAPRYAGLLPTSTGAFQADINPSAAGSQVIQRIAVARLSEAQKDSLLRVTAYIDAFEQGNPSRHRDTLNLLKLLEADNGNNQGFQLSLSEAGEIYLDHRRSANSGEEIDLSVDSAFRQASPKYFRDDEPSGLAPTLSQVGDALSFARDVLSGGNPFAGTGVDIHA